MKPSPQSAPERPRFSLVNLGCPKNTVDSERIIGAMSLAGFAYVPDPADAHVCIVNTCGFLDAARREARDTLAELARRRGDGEWPVLVAVGCAVERLGGSAELAEAGFLEGADLRAGFADYPKLPEICLGQVRARRARGFAGGGRLPRGYMSWLSEPRMITGAPWSAYLKIGEGCSNCCAYCSIPLVRGRRTSRTRKAVLAEARELLASGVRELTLIAQDTTAWGLDDQPSPAEDASGGWRAPAGSPFAGLLRSLLAEMPERGAWLRVLYAHPRNLNGEILDALVSDPRICPYLDLPLQHVNDRMLRLMGRGYGRARVDRLLAELRARWPGVALRSTFIVGHPGETEAAWEELLGFVKGGAIDNLGVFEWSPEPDTRSVALPDCRVPPAVAAERRRILMRAQKAVSRRRLRARVGQATEFLPDRWQDGFWIGRTPWQAPDGIDGETLVGAPRRSLKAGEFARIRITGSGDYHLEGEPLRKGK